jgi:hypothetical protein
MDRHQKNSQSLVCRLHSAAKRASSHVRPQSHEQLNAIDAAGASASAPSCPLDAIAAKGFVPLAA